MAIGSISTGASRSTASTIASFSFGAKVQVEEGEGQSPVYAFLGGATGSLPGWNFGKYLVGRDGVPLAFFNSGVAPQDRPVPAPRVTTEPYGA